MNLRYLIFLLEKIHVEIRNLRRHPIVEKKYLDNADIMQTFNISARTLRRLRKNKEIPFEKMGKKYLYSKEMIEKKLNKK
ncbi:helix-turn-helix domain-containing protein [Sinomicrobium sp. M5D2P17]